MSSLDLRDAEAVYSAIDSARPDLVFHLAAQSSVGHSADAAAETWAVNVGGTLNMARAIAVTAPGAVVAFSSSSEVYGSAFNDGTVDEDTVPQPRSVYGRTKRAAEELLSDTLALSNRLRVFRPTNHSGPGQDTRFALPAFADQIAEIESGARPPIIKVGSLTAERDFLDVRDVVAAYCDVLAAVGNERVVTMNVASSRIVPIGLLLDRLLALTNVAVAIMPRMAPRASEIWSTASNNGSLSSW